MKVRDLIFLDVKGRIAHCLLELSSEPDAMTHPEGMQIKITRQDIAKMAGCSREMAGRILKEPEEEKLISAHGKTIVVFGSRQRVKDRPFLDLYSKNNSANFSPGSSARINASPTRKAFTLLSRINCTSALL